MEYEQAILGALIQHNESYDHISQMITADDFSSPFNQRVYRIISATLEAGEPIDLMIASEKMDGSSMKLAEMTSSGIPANVEAYAKKIKELAIRRAYRDLAEELKDHYGNHSTNIEEMEEIVVKATSKANNGSANYEERAGDVLMKAVLSLEDRKRLGGAMDTGFPTYDHLIGGFFPKELIIIGARTSVGKSAIALNIAKYQAEHHVRVFFITLEMTSEKVCLRMISEETGIRMIQMLKGELGPEQFADITTAAGKIYDYEMYLYESYKTGIRDIKAMIRKVKREKDIQIVYIDYLGMIEHPDKNLEYRLQLGEITKQLKQIAEELNIPVVAMVQLNRGAEEKKPSLASIRESGLIEQDADVVLLLHRKRFSEKALLYIAKNRNGATGRINLLFETEKIKFNEASDQGEGWV